MPNNDGSGPILYNTALQVIESKPSLGYVLQPAVSGEMLRGLRTVGTGTLALSSYELNNGAIIEHRKFARYDVLTMAILGGEIIVDSPESVGQAGVVDSSDAGAEGSAYGTSAIESYRNKTVMMKQEYRLWELVSPDDKYDRS